MDAMEICEHAKDWGILVELNGSLDVGTKEEFLSVPSLRDGQQHVILDLAQVDYLDSSGLGALVQVIRSFRDTGKAIALARLQESVLKLLEFTSIDQIVSIVPSLEEGEHLVQQWTQEER